MLIYWRTWLVAKPARQAFVTLPDTIPAPAETAEARQPVAVGRIPER